MANLATDQATAAERRRQALREADARTPVNGCAECGRLALTHPAGHGWDAPTDRIRAARIAARRDPTPARS